VYTVVVVVGQGFARALGVELVAERGEAPLLRVAF